MAKSTLRLNSPPSENDDWQVEDALRTLIRAEEIESDEKLMAKVRKLAAEKMDDMSEIAKSDRADKAVRAGRISDKQAAKLEQG